jgi:hypothetical protein
MNNNSSTAETRLSYSLNTFTWITSTKVELHTESAMECTHSTVVGSAIVAKSGCFTALPDRQGNYQATADAASVSAFEDWSKYVGKVNEERYCADPRGHVVGLTIPDCLPDRIHAVAKIGSLALFMMVRSHISILKCQRGPGNPIEVLLTNACRYHR